MKKISILILTLMVVLILNTTSALAIAYEPGSTEAIKQKVDIANGQMVILSSDVESSIAVNPTTPGSINKPVETLPKKETELNIPTSKDPNINSYNNEIKAVTTDNSKIAEVNKSKDDIKPIFVKAEKPTTDTELVKNKACNSSDFNIIYIVLAFLTGIVATTGFFTFKKKH